MESRKIVFLRFRPKYSQRIKIADFSLRKPIGFDTLLL